MWRNRQVTSMEKVHVLCTWVMNNLVAVTVPAIDFLLMILVHFSVAQCCSGDIIQARYQVSDGRERKQLCMQLPLCDHSLNHQLLQFTSFLTTLTIFFLKGIAYS